jgi:hypothetical protein
LLAIGELIASLQSSRIKRDCWKEAFFVRRI